MPLSRLYGKFADFRNRLYDRDILHSFSLGARSISIGNITTGGTGKTPIVALTARLLVARGETVCILTRGYGRKNPGRRVLVSNGHEVFHDAAIAGDEPVELARRLIGQAIVIADADRVSAAEWARRRFGITAFVLDDAFQHRRARRDIDIVCVDATDPCGGGRTLPAGRLREPLHNLSRADALVITRAGLCEDLSGLRSRLERINKTAPIFISNTKISRFRQLSDFHDDISGPASDEIPWTDLRSSLPIEATKNNDIKLAAFCGLGNPLSFFEQLKRELDGEQAGVQIAFTIPFRDHHAYTQRDIDGLAQRAAAVGVTALLTTAKDAVKLRRLKFEIPCYVAEIEAEIDPMEQFASMLSVSLPAAPSYRPNRKP